ncbi:GGDEF domain-containing protein [Solibacillus sp. FSL H8-0523]|uniref:sensor domain-containing diguanylate cyclase n=1 Tax=Solibacillus sp. FSL H8-0523 TaxID=2954511 RepID=UPI003100EAB7
MVDYQLLVDRFKSDVLSFISMNKKHGMSNESFILLEKSLIKNFAMKDCFLFRVSHDVLKPNFKEFKFSVELTFSEVQPYLNGQQIIEIPDVFSVYPYFQHYTHAVPLMVDGEILAILIFSYEDPTLQINLTQDIVKEISNIYQFILRNYEVQSNENKYRKLYNITDLFHSTMNIDVILENVLVTIEENFTNFEVELILSNDQDRQTRVHIKPFDYLSERPSTIESFVSGEMKEDEVVELGVRLLNAPIKGRQAIYGILQVKAPIEYTFSNTEKEFIRMLAQASGNALENAKLYHQSHRLVSDLQLINETSHRLNMKLSINEMLLFLQKQLLKSFQPMEIGFFFKEGDEYKAMKACTNFLLHESSQTYIEHVEKHFEVTQDSLFIADFSRLIDEEIPFKSIMAIPMIVEERINGFSIVLHEDPYFFSFDSFKLMQSLIHHSSLAISNSILRNRLQEMVDRDHLTKLYARRFSDNYVEQSIQQDDSGMFLLIDIDNFKKVNDTYGHQVGDEVLVQIGSVLQQEIGTRGICSRWGGEELAVYIPNILDHEAIKIAQMVVDIVPQTTSPSVTISAGLITWHKQVRPDFQEIFLHADTALYNAKRSGKNRVCLFEESMELQY